MSRRDYDAAADLLAADAEVVTPEGVSAGAEFSGRDACMAWTGQPRHLGP